MIETAIFLPLFLVALFGMLWAVRAGVLYERVQSAVRYAGLISDRLNPYTSFSLATMYSQLSASTAPGVTCATTSAASTSPTNATAALYDSAPTTTDGATPSQKFWTPLSSSATCAYAGLFGISVGDAGIHQDFIVSTQAPQVWASLALPAFLASTLGTATSTSANQFFYKPIGVDVMMECYPGLKTLANAGLTDAPASTAMPAALPLALVTPTLLPAAAVCTEHS